MTIQLDIFWKLQKQSTPYVKRKKERLRNYINSLTFKKLTNRTKIQRFAKGEIKPITWDEFITGKDFKKLPNQLQLQFE